ncbi:hypothetical protein EJ05DRAFT_476984 [Pseudovirgaria hyperparasitica]|uniref:non-specific serine/threonine protein kinase n=1 Tax=Pseudovirgaria hyperparasitica TaxID=470096 RepID=A0A6A6W792_9PEZI|nr:uncharacterized protein EJ05DRAFT_476984 [Pseudovirgaria hyperparasitica]KAF2757776.1 hypothetical protein EJ05DRAFT_476984 [Pseudovirgaria hyperparasitica]
MPRKTRAIYGKKANKTLCAKVADFNASSSPTRLPLAKTDDVDAVTRRLESVKLDGEETEQRPERRRKALRPRNYSARDVESTKVHVKRGIEEQQKHNVVSDHDIHGIPQNSEEIRCKRDPTTQSSPRRPRGRRRASQAVEDRNTIDQTEPDSEVTSEASHFEGPTYPIIESTPPSSPIQRGWKSRSRRIIEDSPEPVQISRSHISLISVVQDTDSETSLSSLPDSDIETSHIDVEYTRPLLQYCRDPKGRKGPSEFTDWSSSLEERLDIRKIAEASYGEVYRLSVSGPSSLTRSDESVLKLIPLQPSWLNTLSEEDQMDYAWMSTIASVTSEVQLLQRMASTPGFTNFREIRVVQGRPSKFFCSAWKAFNKAQPRHQKSEFPDPSKKISYAEDQLWAVIEMQDAGTDLEHIKVDNIWALWDIFWGVTLAVAKAEEWARFEHRDLHLGNICIRPFDIASPPLIPTSHHGKLFYTNLETTIIDYTLSRADLAPSTTVTTPVAYLDLDADPAVFDGDGQKDYQYDIYRYMRSVFFTNDPNSGYDQPNKKLPAKLKNRGPKTWEGYNPATNAVWLHFVLHQLLTQLPPPPLTQEDYGNTKRAEHISQKAARLERRLRRLDKTLDFRRTDRSDNERFESATQIVEWAILYGWLGEGDILGERRIT